MKKIKCKLCSHKAKDLKNLQAHYTKYHWGEWKKFKQSLDKWTAIHSHELRKGCAICAH